MKLRGWSGYPIYETKNITPYNISDIIKNLKDGDLIARGNGRSYGDSAIGKVTTISMKNFNRIISFDVNSGELIAEAGVLLEDIIKLFLPKGWFPYVTPGSKYVTLGGMVAADVHGKNHHKDGNFSKYVNWIDLINKDGSIKRCSKKENSELFNWSLGGMGLTGIIIKASIKLKKIETSWVKQITLLSKNLDETIDIFEKYMNSTYSAAWIDCVKKGPSMGRSIVYLGEHAKVSDLNSKLKKSPLKIYNKYKKSVPFNLPTWLMSQWLVSAFNSIFYLVKKLKKKKELVHFDSFFYPLDSITGWNKIYGKKGFIQFQCVIPLDKSREGLKNILNCLVKSNLSSFLSVLKRFGKDESRFSFPMEGYTLALDFPLNNKTLKLIKELDNITIKSGGRFYLAKDSRMSADIFRKSDSRIKNFISFREKENLIKYFNSTQSNRLGI